MDRRRYRWWHGVAFYAGVQVLRFTLKMAARKLVDRKPAASQSDQEFYSGERLPVFAPRPVVFPIAWSINNISTIAGGLHVLNLPRETEGRTEFLELQVAAWILFAAFDPAYFELRSPINAAAVTIAYTAVTIASLQAALRKLRDEPAAWSLATTVAWLALANAAGVAQALWNHDPFWKTGPFVQPPEKWLKSNGA